MLGLSVTEPFEEFSERSRLNISISQRVPIVKLDDGLQKLANVEWGFIAPWDTSKRIFNAAGETIAIKRTFSESFKHRRCLIPADGFYEWPNKQTTLIHDADDRPFCFAGLWTGQAMTLITCASNDFMRPIHHRMPAILREDDYTTWLDPQAPGETLQALIAARNWERMQAVPIPKLRPDSASTIEE
jgi:putative SOS response-associated peptidase YedK